MKKTYTLALISLLTLGLVSGCANSSSGSVPSANAGTQSSAPISAEASSSFDISNSITVVRREEGSGTHGAFIELFGIEEKGADGTKTDHTTTEATVAPKTDIMLTNVSGDPYAIGYVSLGSLNDSVKALDIDGVKATAENVKNGSYKIARPFNIATKGEASVLADDFIRFILSAEGQSVVEKNGYIAIDSGAPFTGTKPEGKLVIAGSSSVAPVMEKLKEAYAAVNPAATLEIQQSDSTAGMTGAIDGTCEIGMASRELKDTEKETLTSLAIANDGIAVITSGENPLTALSKDQVKQIYMGALTTWDTVVK